jgi:ATP-binding cassette subfamily B multidrug efflux pump
LVLVDGEIVERGKHDELLARRGAYYELYMKQFRREEPVSPPAAGNGLNPALLPAAAGA